MDTNITPIFKPKRAVFTGILCIAYALLQFYIARVSPQLADANYQMICACYLVFGILFFFKKPNPVHSVLSGILAALCIPAVITVTRNFLYYLRNLQTVAYPLLFIGLSNLFLLIAVAMLLVLSVFACRKAANKGAAKLWVAVTVLSVLSFVCFLICRLFSGFIGILFVQALAEFINMLILCLASRYFAYHTAKPVTAVQAQPTQTEGSVATTVQNGVIDMVAHTFLMIFLGGIWQYIWVYKTTNTLNSVPNFANRNPVTKLLLCIFIPFYFIYWIYQSAKRVDALASEKGLRADCATLSLVLSIFLGICAPILLQYKINEIYSLKK